MGRKMINISPVKKMHQCKIYIVGTPTWQQTGNSSNGPLLPQDIQQATPTNSAD
jgi:hypothetical protein